MGEEEEGEEDVTTNRRAAAGPLMGRMTQIGKESVGVAFNIQAKGLTGLATRISLKSSMKSQDSSMDSHEQTRTDTDRLGAAWPQLRRRPTVEDWHGQETAPEQAEAVRAAIGRLR